MPSTYDLFLENFTLPCSIGIYDHEKQHPQPVQVNLRVTVRRQGRLDQIEHVYNYENLRNTIETVAQRQHFQLQESFCEAILETLAQDPQIQRVQVCTRKLEVYEDCDSVGCEMVWDTQF